MSSRDLHSKHPVAIIGAGLTGLTAAIRLAEQGVDVHIFEAAPKAGGRTRSFYEAKVDCLCDNGPHLLLGAYKATQQLLNDCGIAHHITWQSSLDLPLWDKQRGLFHFQPSAWLPFHLALLKAVAGLPGHNKSSALSMIKLAATLRSKMSDTTTVQQWMQDLSMPSELIHDLIEPLCLGAMNEGIDTACALSFRRVLHESFTNHQQARLGWFSKPMDEALIEPLCERAKGLGVQLHLRSRIRSIQTSPTGIRLQDQTFQQVIITLPAYATDQLLGRTTPCETRAICNIHLWYEQTITLPALFVGSLGSTGQWFFDVSSQMSEQGQQQGKLRHICAVISADKNGLNDQQKGDDLKLVHIINEELKAVTANATLNPVHYRIIKEKRATVLVRSDHTDMDMPKGCIDASERPQPGQLPATIEWAVQRGEKAAKSCLNRLKS
ncbi:MAG: FAD-dependent oxidoreductase [Mariprofundus sp.]|nr:FAD-dependent oxidoreductase [Mariprofundus sp.]